jgi:hypothetical protein
MYSKKLNKMKKKTLSKYKQELWKLFSLYIKKKYETEEGWCRCYTCQKPLKIGTSDCQSGHYYTKKGYPALFFDENNVRPQCYHCNINLSGNIVIFGENLKNEIGYNAMEIMKSKRHDQVKRTKSDYIELIEFYKDKLAQLTNN